MKKLILLCLCMAICITPVFGEGDTRIALDPAKIETQAGRKQLLKQFKRLLDRFPDEADMDDRFQVVDMSGAKTTFGVDDIRERRGEAITAFKRILDLAALYLLNTRLYIRPKLVKWGSFGWGFGGW